MSRLVAALGPYLAGRQPTYAEATLKRVRFRKNDIVLHPENSDYEDIIVAQKKILNQDLTGI